MRESKIMLIHYITAVLIVITGLIHLFANNDPVIGPMIKGNVYFYVANMAVFLASVLFHGFNGVRVVLIELIPNKCWTKLIGWAVLLIGILTFLAGMQTILLSVGLI